MKCRGCGCPVDHESVYVEGVGRMHWSCEVKRLASLLEEAQDIIEQYEAEEYDRQMGGE